MQDSLQPLFDEVFVQILGASPENQRNLYFVALGQKFPYFLRFHFQVVLGSLNARPHFPHLGGVCFFACAPVFAFFLILPFSVVHDFGYGGLGGGGDFNQIQPLLFGQRERLGNFQNAVVRAVIANHPDGRSGYLIV